MLGVITLTRDNWAATLWRMAQTGPFVAGAAIYVLSLFIWIMGLSRVPVSMAYPLLSLGYVVNAIAAYYLFGEAVSATRWAGIAFIIIGVLADRAPRMSGPFLKFAGPELDAATIDGVASVLRSGQLTSGPWVQRFEADLAAQCAGRPVRALTSATAAVEAALQLAGIGPGDEVVTCAQCLTVLNMIVKVGATPVFVDCDLVTRNLDLDAVEAACTSRTRAVACPIAVARCARPTSTGCTGSRGRAACG